jgi:hypothetical protein
MTTTDNHSTTGESVHTGYAASEGLRPIACWDYGFELRRGDACLSHVSVVRCHVEVSATSRSLIQRAPTDCGVL